MRITEVSPGSDAEQAGIRVGDELLAVNGSAVEDAIDLTFKLAWTDEPEVGLELSRDGERYGEAMRAFVGLIRRASADYGGRIRALYFYEWRDNLYHSKIWNVEQSPIHVAFGLCDRFGKPKFDIKELA